MMHFPRRATLSSPLPWHKLSLAIVFLTGISWPSYPQYRLSNDQRIVATVDSIQITAKEFILSYEQGPAFVRKVRNPQRGHLELMINEKLIALTGYENGLQHDPEVVRSVKQLEEALVIEQLLQDDVESKAVDVNEEEIRASMMQSLVKVKIKYLYATQRDELDTVSFQLRTTHANFDSLVRKKAQQLGVSSIDFETDYLVLEDLDPTFQQTISSLEVGEVSDIISTSDGYYILKLENIITKPSSPQEYERSRKRAEEIVRAKKIQKKYQEYLTTFMTGKNVVVKREPFDFLLMQLSSHPPEYLLSDTARQDLEIQPHLDDTLVEFADGIWTVSNFLEQYNRVRYPLDTASPAKLFSSLRWAIGATVMDKSLAAEGYRRGLQHRPEVQQELRLWMEKWIADRQLQSIIQGAGSPEEEWTRLHRTLVELRKKHTIIVNKELLNSLRTTDQGAAPGRIIHSFRIFKLGYLTRLAFPTIYYGWGKYRRFPDFWFDQKHITL